MDSLQALFKKIPAWGWVAVAGGVIVVAFVLPRFIGNQSVHSADQTATDAGTPNAGLPSSIDPLTGVPYDIESQVNPATGLPAYYGAGLTNSNSTSGGITQDQYNALLADINATRGDASIAANYANQQAHKTNAPTKAPPPPAVPVRPPLRPIVGYKVGG